MRGLARCGLQWKNGYSSFNSYRKDKFMNILETIKTQREKLDAKVDAAIAERDAFIASISDAAGHIETRNRRGRQPMSQAQRKKLSQAKKQYWANRKKTAKK